MRSWLVDSGLVHHWLMHSGRCCWHGRRWRMRLYSKSGVVHDRSGALFLGHFTLPLRVGGSDFALMLLVGIDIQHREFTRIADVWNVLALQGFCQGRCATGYVIAAGAITAATTTATTATATRLGSVTGLFGTFSLSGRCRCGCRGLRLSTCLGDRTATVLSWAIVTL